MITVEAKNRIYLSLGRKVVTPDTPIGGTNTSSEKEKEMGDQLRRELHELQDGYMQRRTEAHALLSEGLRRTSPDTGEIKPH